MALAPWQSSSWAQAPSSSAVILHPTQVSTFVDRIDAGANDLAINPNGSLFTADLRTTWSGRGKEGSVGYTIHTDGTVYKAIQQFHSPSGCVFDSEGNLFLASFHGHTVAKFDPNLKPVGVVKKGFKTPGGISLGPDGDLFVCNVWGDSIHRINSSGKSERLCKDKLLNCPWDIVTDSQGVHFVSNGSDGIIVRILPDGTASKLAAVSKHCNGCLAMFDRCLYVAARRDHRIYRVNMRGEVSVFLGTGKRGSLSGNPKTCTLSHPIGIAINADGTAMYVSESFSSDGDLDIISPSRIRKIELRKETVLLTN